MNHSIQISIFVMLIFDFVIFLDLSKTIEIVSACIIVYLQAETNRNQL